MLKSPVINLFYVFPVSGKASRKGNINGQYMRLWIIPYALFYAQKQKEVNADE